ncbi:hypothetical protein, partial [uncultured Campylobacter sp.]|uniref:hypothetical protein n=1 Tax=uncultured Campylobacter sp. TaxID=218934 RepID=UPI0028E8C7E1
QSNCKSGERAADKILSKRGAERNSYVRRTAKIKFAKQLRAKTPVNSAKLGRVQNFLSNLRSFAKFLN